MTHCILGGYYGYNNAGDEWLAEATIDLIKSIDSSIKITVIQNKSVTKLWGDEQVSTRSVKSINTAMKTADLFVIGGGSIFQNATSTKSLIYYLSLVLIAKLNNVKVLLLANGLGPITGILQRLLSKWILNSTHITLRGTVAKQLADSIGIHIGHITADLAFYKHSYKKQQSNTTNIAVSYTPFKRQHDNTIFLQWLRNLNVSLIELQCNKKSDYQWHNKFPVVNVSKDAIHPQHTIKYAIVSRYHAGIFMALKGCPFIIIGKDPKLEGLADQTQQPFIDLSNTLSLNHLEETWNDYINNWAQYQENLDNCIPKLIKDSSHNRIVMESLLK